MEAIGKSIHRRLIHLSRSSHIRYLGSVAFLSCRSCCCALTQSKANMSTCAMFSEDHHPPYARYMVQVRLSAKLPSTEVMKQFSVFNVTLSQALKDLYRREQDSHFIWMRDEDDYDDDDFLAPYSCSCNYWCFSRETPCCSRMNEAYDRFETTFEKIKQNFEVIERGDYNWKHLQLNYNYTSIKKQLDHTSHACIDCQGSTAAEATQ